MAGQLEHANINVGSLDEAVKFLTTALPNFYVRGGGDSPGGGKWLHIGTDSTYLALNEGPDRKGGAEDSSMNHLGFVVDDFEAIRERLTGAGYTESDLTPAHPHRKRVYFLDGDGTEWEFVEYSSQEPHERNDYSQ